MFHYSKTLKIRYCLKKLVDKFKSNKKNDYLDKNTKFVYIKETSKNFCFKNKLFKKLFCKFKISHGIIILIIKYTLKFLNNISLKPKGIVLDNQQLLWKGFAINDINVSQSETMSFFNDLQFILLSFY